MDIDNYIPITSLIKKLMIKSKSENTILKSTTAIKTVSEI